MIEALNFKMLDAALPDLQCKKKGSYIMTYHSQYDQKEEYDHPFI